MTVLKVIVEDEQAELIKKLLNEFSSIKSVEELKESPETAISESASERIKKIIDAAKGKHLFSGIEDPSEWQRQMRKEWDRDF